MTARLIYEAILIEMNKAEAPSLLLEDFNYLFNKAVSLYINKRYNIYDINLQTTDDLRVLKATALLEPFKVKYGSAPGVVTAFNSLQGATYEVELPTDYLHILNCICIFKVNKTFKCYDKDTYMQFPAKRLTSDAWSQVINNWYGRPSYRNPYYFLNHVNPLVSENHSSISIPTNPITDTNLTTANVHGGLKFGTDGEQTTIGLLWSNYKYHTSSVGDTYPMWTTEWESDNLFKVELIASQEAAAKTYYIIWDNKNKEFGLIPTTDISVDSDGNVTNNTNGAYVLQLDTIGNVSIDGSILVVNNTNSALGPYNLVGDSFLILHSNDAVTAGLPREIDLSSLGFNLVEKLAVNRYGNASRVRLEVRYGKNFALCNSNITNVESKIGEGCDANPELTQQITKGC